MNQNIGISFSVTGADSVTAAVKHIKDSLQGLGTDLKNISDALKLDSSFGNAVKDIGEFAAKARAIGKESNKLLDVASALELMAGAAERLARAQKGIQPFSNLVGNAGPIRAAASNMAGSQGVTQHGGPAPTATVKSGSNSTPSGGGALVPFVPFYQGPNWSYGQGPSYAGKEVVASRRRPNWNYGSGRTGTSYRQIPDMNEYIDMTPGVGGTWGFAGSKHKAPPQYNSWFSSNFGRGQNPSWNQGSWFPGWFSSFSNPFANMGPRFAHWAGGGGGTPPGAGLGTPPGAGLGTGGYMKPSSSSSIPGGRMGAQAGLMPLRFLAMYNAVQATGSAFHTTLEHDMFKPTLAEVAPAMQSLWAVGFKKPGDRAEARQNAFDWASKNYHLGQAKDYLGAQGNVASALPVDLTGIANNQKMTNIAMVTAAYTKSKPEEMSELIGKLIASRYNFMSQQKKESYKKDPGKFVNDAEYYGSLIGKVVGGESIWGHGITQHAKHMMPYWAANNIDPAEYLSFAGALSTAGIGDSSAGRGNKRAMGGDLKADAAAVLVATMNPQELKELQKLRDKDPKKVKSYLLQHSGGIRQTLEEMWKTSPMSALETVAPYYQKAKELGYNPQIDLGYSQDFAASTEAKYNLNNVAELRRKTDENREYAKKHGTREFESELASQKEEGGFEKAQYDAAKQKWWAGAEDMERVAYGRTNVGTAADFLNRWSDWRDSGDPAQRVKDIKRIHQTSGLQGGLGNMFNEGDISNVGETIGWKGALGSLTGALIDLGKVITGKREVSDDMQKALDAGKGLDPDLVAKKNREEWAAQEAKEAEKLGSPDVSKGGAGGVNVNGTVTLNIVAPPGFNVTGGGYADTGRGNSIVFSTDGKGVLPGTKR